MTGCAARGYHTRDGLQGVLPAQGELVEAFRWPLLGKAILPFGAKEDGVSLKGILIDAKVDGNVLAASGGTVVYVDEKLRGYGKTVIVDHADGFSTTYARVSKILVRRGQSVRKGQPIARVGREGKGNLPQLYFELRKNSRAEDPMRYLSNVQ